MSKAGNTKKRNKKGYKKCWPRKNLGELINFIEERHGCMPKLADIARRLEVQEGEISNLFRKDDMSLRKAEEIVHKYGYELRLYFPVRIHKDGYVPRPPRYMYPCAGNLTGLVKYFQDSEYSIAFVAEYCGICTTVVHRAYKEGNIKLSTLYKVLDRFGIRVIWKFEPQQKRTKSQLPTNEFEGL